MVRSRVVGTTMEARLGEWSLALCLLAIPGLALGQSLGDVARKERQRRERPGENVPVSRTLTEDDLATTRGRLANDPGEPVAGTQEVQETSRSAESPAPVVAAASPSPTSQEAYWRGRARQARDRVAAADRRYRSLLRMIQYGQPLMFDANGRRVIDSAQAMKARADRAESELHAAEKALENLADEARRAGALPGWLRE
jgi:hypothetical protein